MGDINRHHLIPSSKGGKSNEYNIENVDVIIGGPPCQGFSIAGKRIIEDERNKLYKAFLHTDS